MGARVRDAVRMRIHGPDGTAPPGSNSASGETYRVQIGKRYQDEAGNPYHPKVHNPRSPTMTHPLQMPHTSRGHHSIQVSDVRYC